MQGTGQHRRGRRSCRSRPGLGARGPPPLAKPSLARWVWDSPAPRSGAPVLGSCHPPQQGSPGAQGADGCRSVLCHPARTSSRGEQRVALAPPPPRKVQQDVAPAQPHSPAAVPATGSGLGENRSPSGQEGWLPTLVRGQGAGESPMEGQRGPRQQPRSGGCWS